MANINEILRKAILDGINEANENDNNQVQTSVNGDGTNVQQETSGAQVQTGNQQTAQGSIGKNDASAQTQNVDNAKADEQTLLKKQGEAVKNKFNEMNKYMEGIDQNSDKAIDDAIKFFKNGVETLSRCAGAFDKRYSKWIDNALKSFENGNAKLGEVKKQMANLKQLSDNVSKMTGQNPGGGENAKSETGESTK